MMKKSAPLICEPMPTPPQPALAGACSCRSRSEVVPLATVATARPRLELDWVNWT